MTDCQVALQQIRMGLHCPKRLRNNKHSRIVKLIAQTIAAWPRPLRLHKVRSHIDVRGNTLAHKPAEQIHEDETARAQESAARSRGRTQSGAHAVLDHV